MNKKKLPRHTSHRRFFHRSPSSPGLLFLAATSPGGWCDCNFFFAFASADLPPPPQKDSFFPFSFHSLSAASGAARSSVGRLGKEGPSFLSAKRRRRRVLKG